ncbi:enoyl-CoA hydratase/isomerase family protein [Micromonospora sp. HUAS LYJ1]|uniref:enoyl-CoA hydratase/isomerase family protein n=1 Tax=Micromonospora sp. HUAS LYJ1 TaxID=3061626 RepID=UPI002673B913|nr:enoyl-CoA hydratase-related protein [Micromonospora sp. HUAS LYJ1]WKU03546.1 enoyl-CoA hydratase-related protein [Micromonospora sp. HUAS LYJ1]
MTRVDVARLGAVARVRLNRPATKNAIDQAMWAGLKEAAEQLASDDSVRAVLLCGAGGDFSSGADLRDSGDAHHTTRMRYWNSVVAQWHHLPKPTVAAVSGVCVGIGMNLALGCDLVVADPRARFCEIFSRRGLVVDGGGSWLLPRLVGLAHAKRLVMLGDFVSADEALRLGLVGEVSGEGAAEERALELSERLAAGPTIALGLSKALLNASFDSSYAQALAAEANAQTVAVGTQDVKEAVRAFQDKTEVVFHGR